MKSKIVWAKCIDFQGKATDFTEGFTRCIGSNSISTQDCAIDFDPITSELLVGRSGPTSFDIFRISENGSVQDQNILTSTKPGDFFTIGSFVLQGDEVQASVYSKDAYHYVSVPRPFKEFDLRTGMVPEGSYYMSPGQFFKRDSDSFIWYSQDSRKGTSDEEWYQLIETISYVPTDKKFKFGNAKAVFETLQSPITLNARLIDGVITTKKSVFALIRSYRLVGDQSTTNRSIQDIGYFLKNLETQEEHRYHFETETRFHSNSVFCNSDSEVIIAVSDHTFTKPEIKIFNMNLTSIQVESESYSFSGQGSIRVLGVSLIDAENVLLSVERGGPDPKLTQSEQNSEFILMKFGMRTKQFEIISMMNVPKEGPALLVKHQGGNVAIVY